MKNNSKNYLPKINSAKEKIKIVEFLKKTFKEQGIKSAVIGLSGGVDSTTSFYLLKEALPLKNIFIMHLYYEKSSFDNLQKVLDSLKFPRENLKIISIKSTVEKVAKDLDIELSEHNKVRIGNISARIRMISLFDLSKEKNALVVGTENKSENLLGYFTRFGDQASDIEPIEHLYKTQIFKLARHLGVPNEIINQTPSAGLWIGQTDEGEFGFTYEEADQVLYLSIEKSMTTDQIQNLGFKNAKKILERRQANLFKHLTPYHL